MEQVVMAVNQIIILGLICATGFIAGRRKWLPENTSTVLAQVIVRITLPALILTTMANYSFTRKELVDGLWVFLLGAAFMFAAFLFGSFTSRLLKLPPATRDIYRMLSILGNIGFLAFPIIQSMFGEKGIIYSIFYMILNDTSVWTIGIYFLNRHNSRSFKENLRHFINPNTVSFVIGIAFVAIGYKDLAGRTLFTQKLYQLLYNSFNPLGKTTSYMAMLFIGLILSEVKISGFSEIIRRYPVFILAASKLLLIPAFAIVVLNLAGGFVDPFVRDIVVLMLGMPSGTLIPVLAAQFNTDYKFAAEGVFITTLLGIVTIPILLFMLRTILF
jgi:predicted permease